MTYQLRPAVREQTPIIIGLAGPSKSGKTKSALRLATGLAAGGKIGMINTEGKRGHLYAEEFKYEAIDIADSFSYSKYREALLALKAAGVAVGIIDSVSHAHEGPGGMLEQHEKYLDEKAGNDYKKRERLTWAAWIKPKAEEAIFCNTMIQVDFPLILCFRAKEKLKIVKGADPIDLGWQPICSDRIPFETTATIILPAGCKGVPDLSALGSELRDPLGTIIKPEQINEDLGKRLAAWAMGAKPPADKPVQTDGCISADQAIVLEDMLREKRVSKEKLLAAIGKTYGAKIERLSQIRATDYDDARAYIEKRAA